MVDMFKTFVEVLEDLIAKIMEFVNELKGASADKMPWDK